MESTPPPKFFTSNSSPFLLQPSSSNSSSPGGGGSSVGSGYIEHTVSKFDTLAGVAIKYGVEVADIKRMNGLTTDLQMFALKSLQIPLPGRHPPSPIMSNGYDMQGPTSSEVTPPNHRHSDLFDSIKSLKLSSSSSSQRNASPAVNTLRGYYGLKSNDQNGVAESCNMAVYQKGVGHCLKDGPQSKPPQISNPPLGLHRKSRSLANGLSETGDVLGKEAGSDKWFEKLVRRRKSEVDLRNHTPEMLLKQDNSSNISGAFSAAAGKGLALRPKAGSRITIDAEAGSQNLFPSPMGETLSGVRKSSSTPSFQDSDSTSSSIWPTSMLSLTADLQALSTAAITRPIFYGLPKPINDRKNKAALD